MPEKMAGDEQWSPVRGTILMDFWIRYTQSKRWVCYDTQYGFCDPSETISEKYDGIRDETS
jgi:hypothetical protein